MGRGRLGAGGGYEDVPSVHSNLDEFVDEDEGMLESHHAAGLLGRDDPLAAPDHERNGFGSSLGAGLVRHRQNHNTPTYAKIPRDDVDLRDVVAIQDVVDEEEGVDGHAHSYLVEQQKRRMAAFAPNSPTRAHSHPIETDDASQRGSNIFKLLGSVLLFLAALISLLLSIQKGYFPPKIHLHNFVDDDDDIFGDDALPIEGAPADEGPASKSLHFDPDTTLHSYNPFHLDPQVADWYGGAFVSPPALLLDDEEDRALGYLSQPNVFNNTLVFVSEGDLYLTQLQRDRSTSLTAMKLTTTVGNVISPVLNPVYTYLVAYTATYVGHREVYLLDLRSRHPAVRLTYWESPYGVNKVVGWKNDGMTVIFAATSIEVGFPDVRLYELSLAQNGAEPATNDKTKDGGNRYRTLSHAPLRALQVRPVPLTQAIDGVWDEQTNTCLYFTRNSQSSSTIRYVGGTVESLWAYCNEHDEAIPLTSNYKGTSKSPTIYQIGKKQYLLFLTDRLWKNETKSDWIPATMNLWATPLPKESDLYGKGSMPESYVQLTSVSCDFDGMSLIEYAVDGATNNVVLRIGADLHILASRTIRQKLGAATRDLDVATKEIQKLPVAVYSDFHEHQERLVPAEIPEHMGTSDVYRTAFGSTNVLMNLRGQLFSAPVIADVDHQNPYAGAGMNLPPRRYRVAPGTATGGMVRVLAARYVPLYLEKGKTARRVALVLATDPKSETAEHGFYLMEVQSESSPIFVDVKDLPDPFLGGSLNGGSVSDGGLGSVDADTVSVSPCGRRFAWTDKDGRVCVMSTPLYRNETSMPYVVLPDQNNLGEPIVGTEASLSWSPGGRYLAVSHNARNQFDIISIVDCGDPERDGPDVVADVSIIEIVQATPDRFNSKHPYWGKTSLDFVVEKENELLEKLPGSRAPAPTGGSSTLYFLSDRDVVSSSGSPWGSRRPDPNFPARLSVFALPLVSDDDERGPLTASVGRFAGGGAGELWTDNVLALQPTLQPMTSSPGGGAASTETEADSEAVSTDSSKPSSFPKDRLIQFGDRKTLEFARTAYLVGNIPAGSYTNILCQASDDPSLVLVDPEGVKIFSVGDFPSDVMEAFPIQIPERFLSSYDVSTSRSHIVLIYSSVISTLPSKVVVVENTAQGLVSLKSDEKLVKNIVDTDKLALNIWPSLEYQQMYDDAWRLLRDYFYDVNMHGVDWPAIHRRYRPLVRRCAKREELDDVLRQMASEVSALHVFVYGGEYKFPLHGDGTLDRIHELGSLGATLDRSAEWKGYVVTSIPERDPDFNLVDAVAVYSPLSNQSLRLTGQRGLQVGDVIVGVNGESVMSVPDIHMLLRGTSGRSVRLEVLRLASALPATDGSRRVAASPGIEPEPLIVVPITPDEASTLRYDSWEWKTRQLAKKLSAEADFTLGYVHLKAMGYPIDIDAFYRGFFPDYNKQALIVDVRHNHGGNIDTWLLDILQSKAWDYMQGRATNVTNGGLGWEEQYAFRGHLVVLMDEHTSSNGEGFSRGVSELGLGRLVGMRTWGGGIWLSSDNKLVDGGIATAPEFGTYNDNFGWGSGIEGTGVEPDYTVDNNPRIFYDGKDQQLEFAIDLLKKWLKEEPVEWPKSPGSHNIKAVPREAENCAAR